MRCYECLWKRQVQLWAGMSTCLTRQVGSVLVRDRRLVAAGFNGNLPGHPHCNEGGCDRCNDPDVASGQGLERCVCVHAEQNLVSYCASEGITMKGGSVYLPTTPCLDCFKLLASSKVKEIVYNDPYPGSEGIVQPLASTSKILIRRYQCFCKTNTVPGV